MPKLSKIEQSGLAVLVAELSRTRTNDEIVQILVDEHGLSISPDTVRRYTARIRAQQGQLNREAIEAAIAPTVGRDIGTLDKAITRLEQWFEDDSLRRSERLQVVRELRQVIDTKLRNAGGTAADKLADAVAGFADLAARALEPPA